MFYKSLMLTGFRKPAGKWTALGLICLAFPYIANPAAAKEPVLTRLFYQDRAANQLKWFDIRDADESPVAGEPQTVDGFPKLDSERQRLVQMRYSEGFILVGIRDDDEGGFGSGWVLMNAGVEYENHGDHGHWKYQTLPSVRQALINNEQGNPAHLYVYNNVFYIANDALDGFTRLDPASIPETGNVPTGFHRGGGGHITLAVSDGRAFATWIDGEGENLGRVDVARIQSHGNDSIRRTFFLPTGVIHGATAAAGNVFFAPRHGVCWIPADTIGETVTPRFLSLRDPLDDERPRRTGAFATHGNHVLCVSGSGENAELAIIDARLAEPTRISLALDARDGQKPVTPRCIRTPRGKHYAFVFNDATRELADSGNRPEERLTIVDLDPNGDQDFQDAAIAKTLPIGASAVKGHTGHHSVDFDADGSRAFIANPGDGTITLVRLDSLKVESTITVGGAPESVMAIGGSEH